MSGESKQKRGYTLSERALEQRRAAAARSTGPRTAEGKAVSSRNAWRTGEYSAMHQVQLENAAVIGAFGKPCRSTCPKHPDQNPEHPCSLVLDGLTKPGGDCLDKAVYVDAFGSIMEALQVGEYDAVNGMAAAQVAGAVEVLQRMRESISEDGLLIKIPLTNKDGEVIGHKKVAHPAIGHYIKLLEKLGISLPELMATPKARQKVLDPDDPEDPVTQLFSQLARANAGGGANRPTVIDEAEYTEVDDGPAAE